MSSRSHIAALAILAAGACTDPSEPPRGGTFQVLTAVPPRAAPGLFLYDTIRVRLVDDQGRPLANRPVTWVVRQGGGTVEPLAERTGGDGIAGARWSLGAGTGVNTLEVQTLDGSLTTTFQVLGEAFRIDLLDSEYGLGCGLVQGDVWCWGQYSWVESPRVSDQPEDVFDQNFNAPGLALGGQQFVDLAVGWPGGCGINASGTVLCFASGNPAYAQFPPVPAMRDIVAGEDVFCGIAAADSTAWCWRSLTGAASRLTDSLAFVEIDVAVGSSGLSGYGCGRLVDSTAVCWGDGPRGNGSFTYSDSIAAVSGGMHFAELTVGTDFACGRLANGEVWCWGQNGEGQLGSVGPASALPVLATTGVTRLSAGRRTAIAIRYGAVVRWGDNQLGAPMGPVQSLAGLPVADLSESDDSCVRLVDRQVYCYDELWFSSSSFDVDRYSPVQPVVTP